MSLHQGGGSCSDKRRLIGLRKAGGAGADPVWVWDAVSALETSFKFPRYRSDVATNASMLKRRCAAGGVPDDFCDMNSVAGNFEQRSLPIRV
jgi:hypothetical protein